MQEVAIEVVDKVADEMVSNISYKDTYRTDIDITYKKVTTKVKNDNEKYTYYEFGTGIVGSKNPHIPKSLKQSGWKYDVNAHGELGWWYPTTADDKNNTKKQMEDGTWIAWTKGMIAHKEFYLAGEEARKRIKSLVKEAMQKYMG